MRQAPFAARDLPIGPFSLALFALGLLGIEAGDFALHWQPVPNDFPGRTTFARITGLLECAAAIAIAFPRTRRTGLAAACFIFSAWTALHVPLVVNAPSNVAQWLGLAEPAAIALGLFVGLRPSDSRPAVAAILLFGAALVVFGISHFAYAAFTSEMVPEWLPGRLALTYFTGACHAAAGVAIIAGFWRRTAALLEAAMMSSFVLLVHVPRVASRPQDRLEWTMLAVATALACATFLVARRSREDTAHSASEAWNPRTALGFRARA